MSRAGELVNTRHKKERDTKPYQGRAGTAFDPVEAFYTELVSMASGVVPGCFGGAETRITEALASNPPGIPGQILVSPPTGIGTVLGTDSSLRAPGTLPERTCREATDRATRRAQ